MLKLTIQIKNKEDIKQIEDLQKASRLTTDRGFFLWLIKQLEYWKNRSITNYYNNKNYEKKYNKLLNEINTHKQTIKDLLVLLDDIEDKYKK